MKRAISLLFLLTACQSLSTPISWKDAFDRVGTEQTVCGIVVVVQNIAPSSFTPVSSLLLSDTNFGVAPERISSQWFGRAALAVVFSGASDSLNAYVGKSVCIRGVVSYGVNKSVYLSALEMPR